MFCQNCGTKNDEAAVFCESCGIKLEHPPVAPQPAPAPKVEAVPVTESETAQGGYTKPTSAPKPKAPRKPMSTGAKVGLVAALVVVVALTATYFVLKGMTDPKNKIEEFAKAYVQHDAGKLFEVLEFQESDFVTKEKFEEALKTDKNQHFEDATDYTIESDQDNLKNMTKRDKDEEEKNSLSYTITFRDSANAFEYKKVITLTKMGTKSYLFFDNWRIKLDNFLTKDYAIKVPKSSQISLDGVAISESLLDNENSEEKLNCYKIPYMFSGSHKLQVAMENFNPVEETLSSEAQDYGGSIQASVSTGDMELAEEAKNTLIEKAKDTFQKLYSAMFTKKDFSEVIGQDQVMDGRYEELKENYDNLVASNISEDTHLTKVEFKTVEGNAEKTYGYEDVSDLGVVVTLDTSYQSDSVVKNYWTGKKEKKNYEGEKSFSFTYYLVNGNWLLNASTSFDYCVDYNRY